MTNKHIPKWNSPEYWKTASEYEFKLKGLKEKLQLYAHSSRIAKIKARRYERWNNKQGFGDKVLINTIRKIIYEDGRRIN